MPFEMSSLPACNTYINDLLEGVLQLPRFCARIICGHVIKDSRSSTSVSDVKVKADVTSCVTLATRAENQG